MDGFRSLRAYVGALFGSWWTFLLLVTGLWGVLTFIWPVLGTIVPPQVTWTVAIYAWLVAPFHAYHRLRMEAIGHQLALQHGQQQPILNYHITAEHVTIQQGEVPNIVAALPGGLPPVQAAPDQPPAATVPFAEPQFPAPPAGEVGGEIVLEEEPPE